MRIRRHLLRSLAVLLFALLVVQGALALVLVRTRPGHDFFLRTALSRAELLLDGELSVEALTSGGLLQGFTLHGVRLTDPDGRPFVVADSIRVRYSVPELIRRNVVLVPADIWGPSVVIETLHGAPVSNVDRIFRTRDRSDPGESGGGVALSLRRTRVHGGELLVRSPVEVRPEGARGLYERLDGGGEGDYRILRFHGIEARVGAAELLGPALAGQSFEVEALSVVGEILEEPFVVSELSGRIRREGSGLELDLERLWLAGSEMSVLASLGWGDPEGFRGRFRVEAPLLVLEDFRWFEPGLPAAVGSLNGEISIGAGRLSFRATELDLRSAGSRVAGDFALDLVEGPAFIEANLSLDPLELGELAPWIGPPVTVGGSVAGTFEVSGPPEALALRTEVTFGAAEAGIPPSRAVIEGMVGATDGLEAGRLEISLEPFRYETLRAHFPALEWAGEGRVRLDASGDRTRGVELSGEIEHAAGDFPPTRVLISGAVRPATGDMSLDLAVRLDPLSLEGAALAVGRTLPVAGDLFGDLQATGPLSDLELSASLETPGGALDATARLDLRDPGRRYHLEVAGEDFRLDRIAPDLPDPTLLSGALVLYGTGRALGTLEGTGALTLARGQVGRAPIGSLRSRVSAREGRLRIEELDARSPLIRLSGSGELALVEGAPPGRLDLSFSADSLGALRPVVRGGRVIAADTLTALESDILRFEGIDPDTLGLAEELALAGSARGELLLRGGLPEFRGEGFVEVRGGLLGGAALAHSRADLTGEWRGAESWRADAALELDSLLLPPGFEVTRGTGGVSIDAAGSGAFTFEAEGPGERSYAVEGVLGRDGAGSELALEHLLLASGGERWELAAPARVRLEDQGGLTGALEVVGPSVAAAGADAPPARIAVDGRLDRGGNSDLNLRVSGVDVERLARILQVERPPRGVANLTGRLRGAAERPVIEGEFEVADFAFATFALSRLSGRFRYEDLILEGELDAESGSRRLLSLSGRLPADLSLADEVERRLPDRTIELTAVMDSLPVAMVLGLVEGIEEVEGAVDGRVMVGGSSGQPEPRGEITVEGAGLSIPALGLRPRGIRMDLRVREDLRVEVEGEVSAGGGAAISGSIDLTELTNPGFDLRFGLTGLRAVDRRDLTASIGGELALTGSFRDPRIGGVASFEQGELFLEEFAREAAAVDLSNPLLFDVVDTTVVAGGASGELARSPFLENLRVDVALALEQDFWIRQGMDIELEGELGLSFDRPRRELRLAGSLEAVRGTYTQFGRIFDVETGTLDFVGTPGIDPSLSIQAVHRFRREAGEPLNVLANVGGTLQAPEVTLSSDAQPPIPESDLISYMLFGRPSFALASGEISVVDGAREGLSSVLSQLGTTFSRSLGVDYLSVSQTRQAGNLATLGGPASLFADTQIEMGRYIGENVFLAVTLRPLTGAGAASRRHLPSARLEWRFREDWSTESFVEDRLPRQGRSTFGELDNDVRRVFGISLFRDWGY